jgi:hypothetical protein
MPPSAIDRAAGKPLAHASWLAPDVSSDLSQIIARGLSLLPEQRPHGAVEFRKELERALTEEQEASSPFVSFELEPSGDPGLPPIEDEFGPEELVEQQQTAIVVQEQPRQEISKPAFTEFLGKIARRVGGGIRPALSLLSVPKRQRVDIQSNGAEPTDLMGVQASAPRGAYKRAVIRTITAAVLTLAVLRSGFWVVGKYRDSVAPTAGLRTASADTRTASTRQMLDASGAVQQAGTVREDSAPSKTAAPATSRKEPEPTEESQTLPTLPKVKGVNLGAAIDSNRDLVPVDVMLDLRTQLANGKQQAEDGEYVLARRILAAAVTSADAALGKFAGSRSLRSIRAELDSADRRVLAACRAENDITRKRGGSEKPCQ